MKHWRAAKLPLFDGESGGINSLKEVLTRQTAAIDEGTFKICCSLITFHYTALCHIIQPHIPMPAQYSLLRYITVTHVCALTLRWLNQEFIIGFFFVSRWSCYGGYEP